MFQIYDRALQCVIAVSHRLGTQEFVFGNHPTSIDATLYAYLAPLVKVPFPNTKFKNQVLSHNNLVKYVTRISQRYYAAETQGLLHSFLFFSPFFSLCTLLKQSTVMTSKYIIKITSKTVN